MEVSRMECSWWPLKNTSPFNNVATLLVFGLKTHTHTLTLTNAKYLLPISVVSFSKNWGKVSILQILEVALTPPPCFQMTHFTFCFAHWQCSFSAEVQCSHKCYIAVVCKQNHLHHCASVATVVVGLTLAYWPCVLCKQGGCWQRPLQLYSQKASHSTNTGTVVGMLSESCACAWVS